jgi:hypothetical protein
VGRDEGRRAPRTSTSATTGSDSVVCGASVVFPSHRTGRIRMRTGRETPPTTMPSGGQQG